MRRFSVTLCVGRDRCLCNVPPRFKPAGNTGGLFRSRAAATYRTGLVSRPAARPQPIDPGNTANPAPGLTGKSVRSLAPAQASQGEAANGTAQQGLFKPCSPMGAHQQFGQSEQEPEQCLL